MRLFTLLLLCTFLINCSVNLDNNNDLTTEVAGEYRGFLTTDISQSTEIDVLVIRIDDRTIDIEPSDGNSFLGVTVEVTENSNLDIVNQPDQRFGTTVSFTGNSPIQLIFQIDPSGFNAQFTGTKL